MSKNLPTSDNKQCSIPCLEKKTKAQLIKIAKKNKFKINEELNLADYKYEVLLKFAKKVKFNYSKIESRSYLEQILPCFPKPMLFLGWAKYTSDYKKICDMVTVDYNKNVKPDIVTDITTKDFITQVKNKHKSYKTIVNNGVIGWGVNEPDQIHNALKNCHSLMSINGWMLFGYNESPFEGEDDNTTISKTKMASYLKKYFKNVKLIYSADDEWQQRYFVCRK